MFAVGTVRTTHARIGRTAPDTLHGSVAVDVLSGRSLETAVAVRCGTAIDTAFFVIVVHVKSVGAFGTPRTIGGGTAIRTFCSHSFPRLMLYAIFNIGKSNLFFKPKIWLRTVP